jgi:ubiquitin-protein ligase
MDFDALDNLVFSGHQEIKHNPESIIKSTSLEIFNSHKKPDTHCILYDGKDIIAMIYNDILNIKNDDIIVLPINNNIFMLEVKMINFTNPEIKELNLIIHMPMFWYPYNPPNIEFLSNIDNNLVLSILNLRYFSCLYWNQTNTLKYTLESIKNIINKYGRLSNQEEKLDNLLTSLSNLTKINPPRYNKQDIDIPFISGSLIASSSKGKQVLGYGTVTQADYNNTWNINQYLTSEKKMKQDIKKLLECIIKQNYTNNVIESSCLILYIQNVLLTDYIDDNNDDMEIINYVFIIIRKYPIISTKLTNDIAKFKENNTLTLNNSIIDFLNNIVINNNANNNVYITNLEKYKLLNYSDNSQNKLSDIAIKKIQRELKTFKAMELYESSSVFVRYNENNLSKLYFMITGPENTPYDTGCFIFEVHIPYNYPNTVPTVKNLTTGGGKARFNPNLYNCGKVCLSLLGTWEGHASEKWNPSISNLSQVILSIQGLIFVAKPYYNEPGHATRENEPKSIDYNNQIIEYTKLYAIIDAIKHPNSYFKDAILNHFYYRKEYIKTIPWIDHNIVALLDNLHIL